MSESNTAIHVPRLKRLLRRLLDIYSPSGKEEEILEFLYGYLKRHGLPVARQPVDENRYNLIITPSEFDVRLALMGHLDTVVAYDLDHYGYTEEGDLVRGLGAADMKGSCAAMIEAYLAFWERGRVLPPVALTMVVGEEEEGDGTERLLEDYHYPWVVIGEPTDLRPCLSNYSYLESHVLIHGQRMHASLARMGENPIEAMLRIILRITRYVERERPDLVYNIRDLYSSQAGFVVPDRCEAWVDLHMPPAAPLGEITGELEDLVADECQGNSDLVCALRFATIDAGYNLPEKGLVVEALKGIYERRSLCWDPQGFRSHSDANQIWTAGVKPILLGAGQLEKAHASDESVSFRQVCLAAEIYFELLAAIAS